MRLLFATGDLSLGKHRGVVSSRIEAKLKRFSLSDPRRRGRPRGTCGKKCFWSPILRNINLASIAAGIPSYRSSTRSFACGYRVRRCRNRCRGCRRTSSRRICLGVFRWPACSEEEQWQENGNRRNESFHQVLTRAVSRPIVRQNLRRTNCVLHLTSL
jgi:hypothetical protein